MKIHRAIGLVLVAILLMVVGLLFIWEQYREKAGKPSWLADGGDWFGWLMLFSIAIGIALSVRLTGLVIQKLLAGKPNLLGLSTTAHTGGKIGAYLGGLGSYPFALLLGFYMGGTLGGGLGGELLGRVGFMIGIGLGLCAVTALLSATAALVGFVLGGFIEKLVRAARA